MAGKIAYFPIYMLMFLQKNELPDEVLFETEFSNLGDLNREFIDEKGNP